MKVIHLKQKRVISHPVDQLLKDCVRSIISALEAKDPYTYGHSLRVAEYALLMGRGFGLCEDDLILLELGALLHDIGKIGTPDHILLKPGPLTTQEFEVMKKHPIQSAEILSHIELLKEVVPIVRSHQERVDGKGYPDHLKGEEIPLLSRMVYIADAFDAMTSDRPYRSAWTDDKAYAELRNCIAIQFDEKLTKIFIEEHRKKKHIQSQSPFWGEISEKKAIGG